MKKLVLAISLFFVLATPAFAQGPQGNPWRQGQQKVTEFLQRERTLANQETIRWQGQVNRDLNQVADGVGRMKRIQQAGGPLVVYVCAQSQGVLCAPQK